MVTAIYPGTFDPITYGHIDIAKRASRLFRRIYVVVADNPSKSPFFSAQERVDMVAQSLRDVSNVEIVRFEGLLIGCLREYGASVIIRGLRALSDFDYEFQMAFTNRKMMEEAETVFLMPNEQYTYLNSTSVKQIARFGGDISAFVPEHVERTMQKLREYRA